MTELLVETEMEIKGPRVFASIHVKAGGDLLIDGRRGKVAVEGDIVVEEGGRLSTKGNVKCHHLYNAGSVSVE